MDFSHYNGTPDGLFTNSFQSKCRIRCHGSRIQVGEREFISASEALQAYMDQYAGLKPKGDKYDMNVTDLLDPKSVLHQTAERSLKTGVRATPTELKLAQSRDSINNSYDRMNKSSALRAEAEDALNRSGRLLNRLANDEKVPMVGAASDVGSMATDVLLSMNPVGGYSKEYTAALAAASEAEEPKRRGHVYSYRTALTRSRSLSRERPGAESDLQPELKKDSKTNKPPSSYRPPVSGSGLPRERSRSVSPSSFRQHDRLFSDPQSASRKDFRLDTNTSKHKAPSWIEALDISNPGDNLWSKRDLIAGRPPPSWVQGLDGSDVNSLVSGVTSYQTDINNLLAPNMDISGLGNSTLSNPPGLSYKDLMVTPTKGKSVNFDLSSNNFTPRKLPGEKFEIASKLPREVLESGNTKLDSSDALDRYLEGLGCGPKPPTSSGLTGINSDSQYDAPRCSSLDTTALLNGLSAPTKSDITGASPISRSGKSPMGSPIRQSRSRSRPQTPDTDLVLDGDRPWEKPLASIKAPVYISEEESGPGDAAGECDTLTGRTQLGSLETLKNMLFKLQAEASEETTNREKIAQIIAASRKELNASNSSLKPDEDLPALKGYNFQGEPGGQSLEKAMVHLGRLKDLVEVGKIEQRSRSASRDRSMSRSRSVSPLRLLSQPILS
ncbi:uncharacterized protein LOC110453730 isoform X2 [Mizuhopecten yessoensis]|uniref:uncharacterized protein LOC110453730 isoform X2 n=1 Tax=Mizuhopecten yessoensis TaxID=6573 RepID=UPI000B45C4FB|nr:uncharacterized protein LOC110453730 isoform X2 [Mizuhopecten yessoensis]